MKIIHTSDWHLGSSWRGIDRTAELFGQVSQVCEIVQNTGADVLLVTGDVFERVGRDKLTQVTNRLADTLKPLIANGVHIVLVPGNHDLREHFSLLKTWLRLNPGSSDFVHVADGVKIFDINNVQFVCVPYPERELLEKWDEQRKIENVDKEERNRYLSNNLVEVVRHLDQNKIDAARPALFAAHLQIYGAKPASESEKELYYLDDICLSAGDLPTNVAYVALGHIHCRQQIAHSVPAWYSGNFDCFNVGEIADEKGVLLVEINGLSDASVEFVPLKTTEFVDLRICSSEVENKAAEYVDSRKIYGRVEIDCAAGVDAIAVRREASKLFGCCEIRLTGEAFKTSAVIALNDPHDRRQSVLDYLDERFANDADLPELKILAEQLIEEVSDAFAKN